MKKLLYTFLIGLMVISCTQDDLDADISVLAPAQEIEAIIDHSDLHARVMNSLIESLTPSDWGTKTSNSNTSSKGNDYIHVALFTQTGEDGVDYTYVYLSSEEGSDVDFGCAQATQELTVTENFWDNSAGDGSVLNIEDANEVDVNSFNGSFSTLFSLDINSLGKTYFNDGGKLIIDAVSTLDDSSRASF